MRKRYLIPIVALLAGCSSGVTGITTVTGSWTLRTINNAALPYTISGSGANKTEVIDDVITLFEGFTYSETSHRRVTVDGQQSTVAVVDTGPYSLFGTSITLTPNSGALARRGLIEGNVMTIVEDGLVQDYKK
jgi:hypothetical protein